MSNIKNWVFFLALAASAAFSFALIASRYEVLLVFKLIGESLPTGEFAAISGIAAALLSLTLAYSSWKAIRTLGSSAPRGFWFLVVAIISFLQSCVAISMIFTASDTSKTFAAMIDVGRADVYSVEPGHLVVEGPIGMTFYDDVMAGQGGNEPITTIEIDSSGGLIDQALKLAAYIEIQKVKVIVGDQCLSACVLVAVASPELTAHESSIFGFHRSAEVASTTSQFFSIGKNAIGIESDQFLKDHGIPREIMREGETRGPDEMYEVKAAILRQAGVVKKIIADASIELYTDAK